MPEDLENARKLAIDLYHLHGIDSGSIFRIPGLRNEKVQLYKLKKFACRSLKGRGAKSGIRVIYAFVPDSMKVVLIEIYFKGDKSKEDRQRMRKFLKDSVFCFDR